MQTEGQTNMTKLIAAYFNFANEPKKTSGPCPASNPDFPAHNLVTILNRRPGSLHIHKYLFNITEYDVVLSGLLNCIALLT